MTAVVEARTVGLRDGRTVVVRPVLAADADALRAALERADPHDLRARFMGSVPPIGSLVDQLARADGTHDFALGAFDDSGALVGVAQFDRSDDGPVAEVAVEVAHDWQRCGLAGALVRGVADVARQRGIHRFTASYFADNFAIRRLLEHTGQVVESGFDHGEGHAVLDLDATNGGSG